MTKRTANKYFLTVQDQRLWTSPLTILVFIIFFTFPISAYLRNTRQNHISSLPFPIQRVYVFSIFEYKIEIPGEDLTISTIVYSGNLRRNNLHDFLVEFI